MDESALDAVECFIARWSSADGSERANYQLFVTELCDLLGLPKPDPARADSGENAYVFERRVTFRGGDGSATPNFADCYRRGAFVLEAKKLKALAGGAPARGFDDALLRARAQAEGYARALPAEEGRPPFLVVVDVGHVVELYAEFTRSGGTYVPFPDPRSHRIRLADLREEPIRERLRAVWLDPLSLDPTRQSARVTREIALHLAEVAKSLEAAGHAAESVAGFLTRCLFSMFAEDVGLIPKGAFTELLESLRDDPAQFVPLVGALWQEMDRGGFSVVLRRTLPRFNGKLFKHPEVLPVTKAQIGLLIKAARTDWTLVEPAIFGTLLERALDPAERHALGAHYTPRAYVERLVLPTVVEPLRGAWADVQAAALLLANEGKEKEAVAEIRAFHHRLCRFRVLDPACGSGNFLYVALEHLKRLEGEVLNQLHEFGHGQAMLETEGLSVDPHQFLGLEVNPRAAAIAELVLWIGYLQWHFRTRGAGLPPQPVLRDFRNIECRDAVLAHDGVEFVADARGVPVTRWDGRTTKKHPVTGEDVPDETTRVPLERYLNPRPAAWPQADVVVGNPPFIGKGGSIREALGDGYVEALRAAWQDVPDSADFVMFWWSHAAALVRAGALSRFGFITTNSLRQTFNRRVLERAMAPAGETPAAGAAGGPKSSAGVGKTSGAADGAEAGAGGASASPFTRPAAAKAVESDTPPALHLAFAVPDHPWVDSAEGAAVRIAMTVGAPGAGEGRLLTVIREGGAEGDAVGVEFRERAGTIHADLTIGAEVVGAKPLLANLGVTSNGMMLAGSGFIVSPQEAEALGSSPIIREYRNGRDLMGKPRGAKVIDCFGLAAADVRARYPAVFQRLLERVKPERDANRDAGFRENWWQFGRPRPGLRAALADLPRYVATVETAKHRVFQYLDAAVAPDHMLIAIALDDPWALGVLSSHVHVVWALAAGGRLGVGNDPRYNKSRCFETFPFPAATPAQRTSIGELAEHIDAHRKRVLAQHGELTLTGLYNVLAKLRGAEPLTAKDKAIHDKGLVGVLQSLHEELDTAVLQAYGWPDRADDETLLERLVALNAERAREEASGHIRWLRPEFQTSKSTQASQAGVGVSRPTICDSHEEAGTPPSPPPPPVAPPPAPTLASPAAMTTASPTARHPWPATLPDQIAAVARVLAQSPAPLLETDLAARFTGKGPWKKRLPQLLETLAALGRVRRQDDGGWSGT